MKRQWTPSVSLLLITHDTQHRRKEVLGELAQLGERLVCNQEVTGSSPVFSTLFGLQRPPAFAARSGTPGGPARSQVRSFRLRAAAWGGRIESSRERHGAGPTGHAGGASGKALFTTEYPANGSFFRPQHTCSVQGTIACRYQPSADSFQPFR